MRYYKPFTLEQKRKAGIEYKSYRRNFRLLKARYPPASKKERRLLREYQGYIRAFGLEAAKELRGVDPELLNDLESRANFVLAEYFSEKLKGRGKP